MSKLVVKDLVVSVDGKTLLNGVNLEVQSGKVHVLMGPNGSGKTSLSYALMGHPKYKIVSGKILLDGEDITKLAPNERARKGLFLSFQYPAEISGVTLMNFLRSSREAVTGEKMGVVDFHEFLKKKMADLKMDSSFSKRYVNAGFSGGEKKRAEILQLSVLSPKFAILDEPDSGTDVDVLKLMGETLNTIKTNTNVGFLLITHHNKILDYLKVDIVSVIVNGRIVETGTDQLAKRIELEGYSRYGPKVIV